MAFKGDISLKREVDALGHKGADLIADKIT